MPAFSALAWWVKALIILAICAVVYWGVDHALGNVKQAGYTQAQADDKKLLDAKDAVIASMKQQVAAANDAANKAKQDADERVRQAEKNAQQTQADIQTQAQKELDNEKSSHDQFVADLYAGRIRLRLPGTAAPAASSNGPGQLPGTAAGAGGRSDGGTCELRPETSAGLAAITGDANRLAITLNKYKKIVLADRALCNGAPPPPASP